MRIAVILAATCIVWSGTSLEAVAQAQEKSSIHIPAQPLGPALKAFAMDRRIHLVFRSELVDKLSTGGVSGEMTWEEALTRLLAGTRLTYKHLDEGTVTIVPMTEGEGEKTTRAGAPADQMRLAVVDDERNGDARTAQIRKDADEKEKADVIVHDRKFRPFAGGNADIPRTIDDHQPYYIFDAKTIEQSGAVDIENFLKQYLTMNAVAQTNGQMVGEILGNTSTIDLRGLGADKTLILINGRRMAGVNYTTEDYQPDLNGIPLSAIERIEVLPSSASGIYGGSAIGGVVNVVLKQHYTGGEVRMNYDNSMDGESPIRNVSTSYGLSLEGGRTHLNFVAAWSDRKPMLLRDRVWIYQKHLDEIQSRDPIAVYSSTNPWLGALPNIAPQSASVQTLTLKEAYGGIELGSRNTHVPAGTAPGLSTAELAQLLLANAGEWNMEFPHTTQPPNGLLRPFGSAPRTRSLRTSLRRQMFSWLDLTLDAGWTENRTHSIHTVPNNFTVPVNAPTNPFTTPVRVRIPDASLFPFDTRSQNRSATLGLLARLPWDWTGMLDYTWSENRFDYSYYSLSGAFETDLGNGTLNPFVDTLMYPLDLGKYLYPGVYQGSNRMEDVTLRASGPLPALPWGQPHLTVNLGRRSSYTPPRAVEVDQPLTPISSYMMYYYARESATDSAYLETQVPLVKSGWLPGIHGLDLQLAGRIERFHVHTGTTHELHYYNFNPPLIRYGTPNLNGEPIFSTDTYSSTNYTVGLKYQPVKQVTLRVSRATAFLPPTPMQLIKDPLPSTFPTYVDDPLTGQQAVPVYTLGGGNPDLRPQHSKSLNAGIIWEPPFKRLEGLRLNLEYYRIEQFDAISNLSAQAIVDQQEAYPERITRDENGTISLVDTSMLNLYHRDTAGWDLGIQYAITTQAGRFSINASETMVRYLKRQYAPFVPEYDALHFPSEGGTAKYKGNASLRWEAGSLMLGWSIRYFGSYKQWGSPGGPNATTNLQKGLPLQTTYVVRQGGDTIPSQMYHDLLLGYSFGGTPAAMPNRFGKLSLLLGVRNVFDKLAPMDAYYAGNFYLSPYNDVRLRSYWLNVRMGF